MKDVLTANASGTIMLSMAIEAMYPSMRLIHVFLDMADTITRNWCARPGWTFWPECRIKLDSVPATPHSQPDTNVCGG